MLGMKLVHGQVLVGGIAPDFFTYFLVQAFGAGLCQAVFQRLAHQGVVGVGRLRLTDTWAYALAGGDRGRLFVHGTGEDAYLVFRLAFVSKKVRQRQAETVIAGGLLTKHRQDERLVGGRGKDEDVVFARTGGIELHRAAHAHVAAQQRQFSLCVQIKRQGLSGLATVLLTESLHPSTAARVTSMHVHYPAKAWRNAPCMKEVSPVDVAQQV